MRSALLRALRRCAAALPLGLSRNRPHAAAWRGGTAAGAVTRRPHTVDHPRGGTADYARPMAARRDAACGLTLPRCRTTRRRQWMLG